ncbi:uncharacterized protein METZ01_LOCUS441051, partial [marine metagenome]
MKKFIESGKNLGTVIEAYGCFFVYLGFSSNIAQDAPLAIFQQKIEPKTFYVQVLQR